MNDINNAICNALEALGFVKISKEMMPVWGQGDGFYLHAHYVKDDNVVLRDRDQTIFSWFYNGEPMPEDFFFELNDKNMNDESFIDHHRKLRGESTSVAWYLKHKPK